MTAHSCFTGDEDIFTGPVCCQDTEVRISKDVFAEVFEPNCFSE